MKIWAKFPDLVKGENQAEGTSLKDGFKLVTSKKRNKKQNSKDRTNTILMSSLSKSSS